MPAIDIPIVLITELSVFDCDFDFLFGHLIFFQREFKSIIDHVSILVPHIDYLVAQLEMNLLHSSFYSAVAMNGPEIPFY